MKTKSMLGVLAVDAAGEVQLKNHQSSPASLSEGGPGGDSKLGSPVENRRKVLAGLAQLVEETLTYWDNQSHVGFDADQAEHVYSLLGGLVDVVTPDVSPAVASIASEGAPSADDANRFMVGIFRDLQEDCARTSRDLSLTTAALVRMTDAYRLAREECEQLRGRIQSQREEDDEERERADIAARDDFAPEGFSHEASRNREVAS